MYRGERVPGTVACDAQVHDIRGDVSVRADVERAVEGADVIFHLASQTSVYVAEADPAADVSANLLPMLHILEASRAAGSKPIVIMAGTATQAGLPQHLPVDERVPDAPRTIYDAHKLASERYLKLYSQTGHVIGATLRLANVYGPGPRASGKGRGVLNTMIERAIAGETLKIYGSGYYLRDYIFIDDAAHAFTLAAQNAENVNGKHFVIGTGEGHTLADAIGLVARLVGERTGRTVRVEHVDPPASLSPIESRNFVADPTAFRQATGWEVRVSFHQGISLTVDDFLAKEALG